MLAVSNAAGLDSGLAMVVPELLLLRSQRRQLIPVPLSIGNWARTHEKPTKPAKPRRNRTRWYGAQSNEIAHHGLFAYRLHREGREFESLAAYTPSRVHALRPGKPT